MGNARARGGVEGTAALSQERLRAVSREVIRYRREGVHLQHAPRWDLRSEQEADVVRDLVAEGVGEAVAGWKLGALDDAARSRLGLGKPFIGRVFRSRQQTSPAVLSRLVLPTVYLEAEVAFSVGRDMPPRLEPYRLDEMKAAISGCYPAFEIVDFTGPGREGMRGLDIVADNGGCGGMVTGSPAPHWRELDLLQESVVLEIDGAVVAQGRVQKTSDQLIAHVMDFANYLGTCGMTLEAGQFVTTGTWSGMHPLQAGQTAVARFTQLGEVRASMPRWKSAAPAARIQPE